MKFYEGYPALHYAAAGGHTISVKLILSIPYIDINAQIADGWKKGYTILHLAADEKHSESD